MNDLINLMPFGEQHFQKTFEWISDPELRHMFLMRGEPLWESHIAYCTRITSDPNRRVYAICIGEDHVGNCGLKNIVDKVEGELWIYMGPPGVRGKGIGTTAIKLLLKEGFGSLGLGLIYLHVADFNAAAISMYKNLCFVEVPLGGDTGDWAERGCRIIRMALERL